ncbi:MAG: hypothetical protein V3T72_08250 [Thermoanaerobaculia bacterium]
MAVKPSPPAALGRAHRLVAEHGWNATAYQILNPGIERWFSAAGDAVIGYVTSARYRVVAGSPICAREHLGEVVSEFDGLDAYKAKYLPESWEPVYAITSERRIGLGTLYAIAGAFGKMSPVLLAFRALLRAGGQEIAWLRGSMYRR